jgi:hypothetical protein
MAATFSALATAVTWSTSAKTMLSLWNPAGSGKIIKVYRIWISSAQTAAVTGVIAPVQINRITAFTQATAITPIAYDTNDAALSTIVAGSATTVTSSTVFRRFQFSTDEPSVGTAVTSDEYQVLVPLSLHWDCGYGSSILEPITCNEGQGVAIVTAGIASATGSADFRIEFTVI